MFILETPNAFFVGEVGYVLDKKLAKRFASLDDLPERVSERDKHAFTHRKETPDFFYIVEVVD